nr:MAG TPA: hypothetical protein [Caudoviricetes sp.]
MFLYPIQYLLKYYFYHFLLKYNLLYKTYKYQAILLILLAHL